MNTREHTAMKMRGNPDISYLGHTVDQMIWSFMEQEKIDGLALAIVQAPYIPRVAGYGGAWLPPTPCGPPALSPRPLRQWPLCSFMRTADWM